MRSLTSFISESDDKDKPVMQRGDIKFTIWEGPDKKVTMLDDNNKYQKIEYKYENKEEGISIDFLLGFQDKSWKIWIGKIGSTSYDDDPYCSFKTDEFKEAILMALDKVEEFIAKVKDDQDNYIQYYVKR